MADKRKPREQMNWDELDRYDRRRSWLALAIAFIVFVGLLCFEGWFLSVTNGTPFQWWYLPVIVVGGLFDCLTVVFGVAVVMEM